MTDMKAQIERKLIAAQLSDWCTHKEGIIFDSSLCTQERCIRFQTPVLLMIFPNNNSKTGVWDSGRFFMYEIHNEFEDIRITCSVSIDGLSVEQQKNCLQLFQSCNATIESNKKVCVLREWKYKNPGIENIKAMMNKFFETEFSFFENELIIWTENHKNEVDSKSNANKEKNSKEKISEEIFIEGAIEEILTNKYERNPVARKKCIEFYGSACKICGIDFGKKYGKEFTGKIEVHHKIPLYLIKEDYVVDPVNDLIPVCPNCHMILHSKKDGVYTIDEVKNMLINNKNEKESN